MRYAQSLGLVIVLIFINACGGSSSPSFYGPWQFTFTSTTAFPGTVFTGSTTLGQGGTGIVGTVTFTNNPCATSALLSGVITGTTVSLQISEGGQVLNLSGTINSADSSMSGTYTATAGGCTNGDTGSWSASAGGEMSVKG
jgi:hypothetical protein